jgi:hypothetical protein
LDKERPREKLSCRDAVHFGIRRSRPEESRTPLRVRPVAPKIRWRSVRSLAFFEALCHFARDFLRGSSSKIGLDRCESEVNLIVHRERPRQTAAGTKPGHLEMGAPSAIRSASLVFWLFGGEFFEVEHRRERDGKIPPRLRFGPLGGSQPPCGRSRPACPDGRRIVRSR